VGDTHAGLMGDCGVFSFYPVKHMTTAEGGMIILKDADLAAKLRLKKAFGVDRTHGERKVPGVYDVIELGFNYRMSEIHAAIGIEQVRKVRGFLDSRRDNYVALAGRLREMEEITVLRSTHDRFQSSYYCLSIMLSDRLALRRPDIMAALSKRGVGTSVYYPQPVPRMTYYAKKYGWTDGNFPNASWLADNSIALPVGPHIAVDSMTLIADALAKTLEEMSQ